MPAQILVVGVLIARCIFVVKRRLRALLSFHQSFRFKELIQHTFSLVLVERAQHRLCPWSCCLLAGTRSLHLAAADPRLSRFSPGIAKHRGSPHLLPTQRVVDEPDALFWTQLDLLILDVVVLPAGWTQLGLRYFNRTCSCLNWSEERPSSCFAK